MLLEAGAYGAEDRLTGVTENIMLGQLAPVGTALCGMLSLVKEGITDIQPFLPKRATKTMDYITTVPEGAVRVPALEMSDDDCDEIEYNKDVMYTPVPPLSSDELSFVPSSPQCEEFDLHDDLCRPSSPM